MFEMLTDYQIWVSLLTLTALEIVLGIDNLIFLSIVSGRLPKHQQQTARRIGLALALLGRLVLLFSLTWIIGLTEPIFTILDFDVSWRDVVLIGGGAFLIVKGTMETHHMLEGHEGALDRHRHLRLGGRADHLPRRRLRAGLDQHRGRHGRAP